MTAQLAITDERPKFRAYALAALLAAFAFRCKDILALLKVQAAGADFSCFWAGAKAALSAPHRLYDFRYITGLQGWPFGPDMRPFIYPPSALPLFVPFSLAPYWVDYGLWLAATSALFAWAGRRAGAPWWMALFPVVVLVAVCGQVTFLIGGLVLGSLTLPKRLIAAGVLLGLAAAVKPQILVFMPLALIAEGRWRTMATAGLTALALCAASAAIWGIDAWRDWLGALPRFQQAVIFNNPRLVDDAITPYALLVRLGWPGAWAFILAPVSAWLVWTTFRKAEASAADRLIAVVGAALLITPYAMNYEAALLAPAVAAYLARTEDRLWPLFAAAACLYAVGLVYGVTPVLMALALPFIAWVGQRYPRFNFQRDEANLGSLNG